MLCYVTGCYCSWAVEEAWTHAMLCDGMLLLLGGRGGMDLKHRDEVIDDVNSVGVFDGEPHERPLGVLTCSRVLASEHCLKVR